MIDLKKWAQRIIGGGAIAALLLVVFTGTFGYKARLLLLGVFIAEALWFAWFKPSFGKTEDLPDAKLQGVLILRGLLIIACVLGLTLGL